jgi:nicotinamide-nucleotide amidase
LKEDIYAEFDTSLGERLFDILKLKELKLSVAESFTGGRVVAEVIKNPGASAFVNEGVVSYSNQSKIKRLGVEKADLDKHGAVSSVVAYQMAAGLLRSGNCDIAVATTGIAGPKSDDTKKPVGLCYIAVGMKNGVHTYKLNLTGSREEITETAKNTALFLAIKKLKNI